MPDDSDKPDTINTGTEEYKSKTQIKKEMLALQDLGSALVKLNSSQLEKIPLDDTLRQAVIQAQTIKKFGALKRQIQYIGKLMRTAEISDIENALDRIKNHSLEETQRQHRLEKLRNELLSGEENAISKVFDIYPQADRQHLRQLVRRAQQEISQNKPPSFSRKLFRYLRDLDREDSDQL